MTFINRANILSSSFAAIIAAAPLSVSAQQTFKHPLNDAITVTYLGCKDKIAAWQAHLPQGTIHLQLHTIVDGKITLTVTQNIRNKAGAESTLTTMAHGIFTDDGRIGQSRTFRATSVSKGAQLIPTPHPFYSERMVMALKYVQACPATITLNPQQIERLTRDFGEMVKWYKHVPGPDQPPVFAPATPRVVPKTS